MQTFVLNFNSLQPKYRTAQHSMQKLLLQYKSSNHCDTVKINNMSKHFKISPTKYWISSCTVSV